MSFVKWEGGCKRGGVFLSGSVLQSEDCRFENSWRDSFVLFMKHSLAPELRAKAPMLGKEKTLAVALQTLKNSDSRKR